MSNKFDRWIRSKNGTMSIIGIVALLVLVVVIGQLAGWWNIAGGPGTAGLPVAEYALPAGGYTCLPSCETDDGKFLVVVGGEMASFSGSNLVLWVSVPGNMANWELSWFDGDSGKDNSGTVNVRGGNWDNSSAETTYTLYADPLKNGRVGAPLNTWHSNADPMPNNNWYSVSLTNVPAAKAPSGHYFYRLEINHPVGGGGLNAFKLRSTAYLSTGKTNVSGVPLGIVGAFYGMNDFVILYPTPGATIANPGPSNYTGEWNLYFYVPNSPTELTMWDGDFDRGTSASSAADTDDLNTDNVVPPWATGTAVKAEGVGGVGGAGAPADDYWFPLYRREPPVQYELIDPANTPLYTNSEPSGTEEWEEFIVATAGSTRASDLPSVTELKEGFYTLNIQGLDSFNSVWIRVDYEIVPYCVDGPCKPPPEWPEGTCPRTIGYWKNNVKKVLIENKTRGVQESRATLEWGLTNVALSSPLFRSGLNATNPVAITTVARLTDAEANAILQKASGNSMLARALQQNLATWLNLGTGKLGPTTIIHLTMPSGNFDGTVWEALQTAQNIILYERTNAARLEYAKDIADMINNNQLNADPSDILACSAYEDIIPPDEQPPAHDDMPGGPLPPEPPNPTPEPPACFVPDIELAGGYAVVALNPADCQGQQNGLLFHGTSLTQIDGTAYSNGCVRAVGTTDVEVTAPVDYVADQFGDMTLINQGVQQIAPLPASTFEIAPPDCNDPAAIQMDGHDFTGDMFLTPGLYCISGDATINAHDSLFGLGVTLYFTDGKLHVNGGATVQLAAPPLGSSPELAGVVIYLPQSNNSPVMINGNSDSFIGGVVYAPASEIEVVGTGYVFGYQAQFIGWDVRVGGTADVIIDFRSNGVGVCP